MLPKEFPQPSRSIWFSTLPKARLSLNPLVIVERSAARIGDCFHRLPLFALPLDLLPKPSRADRANQRDNHQRPHAELIPAAFTFRRISIGRLGFHRRIIPDRGQPEQG